MSDEGRAIGLDLSGIGILLEGLEPWLARRLTAEWHSFVTSPPDGPFLRVVIGALTRAGDISDRFAPKSMRAQLTPHRARFAMSEGEAVVDSAGTASSRLVRGIS